MLFLPFDLSKKWLYFCSLDSEASVTQGSPVPWLGGVLGKGAAGFCSCCAAGGHRRRWGGGHSQPRGGEGGRRPTRVPGLVTVGGLGNPRPYTLAEMAGGKDRRIVGSLHLLLLATVLTLTAGSRRPVPTAWTQEKVRGHCCVLCPSGSWRVPGRETRPPSSGLAGGGSRMLSPCPGPTRHLGSPCSNLSQAWAPQLVSRLSWRRLGAG